MRTYYTRAHCEARASRLLIRYQEKVGKVLELPIDVDLIGEIVCGLTWDWEDISEDEGETIWARLLPSRRCVQLNERHAHAFKTNSGLDRFTRAHEIGHWELHAEKPDPNQASLFEMEESLPTVFCRGHGASWLERQADWFAAQLLMPADALRAELVGTNTITPAHFGRLRQRFDVSVQAFSLRLKELGLVSPA